jgi:hypothetical protein
VTAFVSAGWRTLMEQSVGSMPVVVVQVLNQDRIEVPDAVHEHPGEALPAQGPDTRSQIALARGAAIGVRMTWMSSAVKTASKLSVNLESPPARGSRTGSRRSVR